MFNRRKTLYHGKEASYEWEIQKERDHYRIQINGEFYCTCDSVSECDEELQSLDDWLKLKRITFREWKNLMKEGYRK